MRQEYPRPQFLREEWMNLNGIWEFEFDDNNVGLLEKWYLKKEFSSRIQVPFVFQSKLSGINDEKFHDVVWYKKRFSISNNWDDKKIILHFGAVDYRAKVFIDGLFIGENEGGNVPFSFDVTDLLVSDEKGIGRTAEIVVRVEDPSEDTTIPRGKQFWKEKSESIWYTRSTGIWQTVWLEPVNKIYISNVKMTPDVDNGKVAIEYELSGQNKESILSCDIKISFKDRVIVDSTNKRVLKSNYVEFDLYEKDIFRGPIHDDGWCWTPENPNLYDIEFILKEEEITLDRVESYFGMRKIHTDKGIVYLNNRPYFQRLVLDQGYWPEGLITAPSDEDYKKDILLSKEMGFNGCRKHQKVEDPRFLYWADKLGFLVWGEMASTIEYSDDAAERFMKEWMRVVKRDYNHPCVITWVPLNESWGIPKAAYSSLEQSYAMSLYYITKSLDNTRLVISNDGWELAKTDICAVHNYNHSTEEELKRYEYFKKSISTVEDILKSMPSGKKIYANGYKYKGEPILLTEFGGLAYKVSDTEGWGYTVVQSSEQYLKDLDRVFEAVYSSEVLYGFCYTQLTDVEQEINGILTYDRQPKVPLEKIRGIVLKWRNNVVGS